jgi:hypothetical protein
MNLETKKQKKKEIKLFCHPKMGNELEKWRVESVNPLFKNTAKPNVCVTQSNGFRLGKIRKINSCARQMSE